MGRKKQTADGFDFKEWYRTNKERLSKQRKRRYATDSRYREKAKADAKDRYHATKSDRVVDRKTLTDGKRFYVTIGKVAELIHRKVQTVRDYHAMKVIPDPTFYDSRGWRLYTHDQVKIIVSVFKAFDRKEIKSLSDVGVILYDRWEKELIDEERRKSG